MENYNGALARISDDSKYCKIVQADDWLFPECLAEMVRVAESDTRIGVVGSYYLQGLFVRGSGIEVGRSKVAGGEVCRIQILQGRFFMGSPTTLMFRSEVVRSRKPFYAEGRYHEDTEAAYEILQQHDFGFCHQVLSYIRIESNSITGLRQSFNPDLLDRLIIIERYGRSFLAEREFVEQLAKIRREHERFLAKCVLKFRGQPLWKYHRDGLRTIDRAMPWPGIAVQGVDIILDLLLNPKATLGRLLRLTKRVGK